ncbi:MAG: ATP-binding protein, partial [Alphaproteobacteria bacterium]|nr:ATP-binding protein [Alphaproteobacteria bacterium]
LHIALVRDIRDQKSLQSQLIQASKLATVGEMAAGIAHELNQPLNIMRMAADNVLIRMEAGSADLDYARDNLSLISEQAGRMGKIILHMRVFSRQDTSDFIRFDPVRAVRNACELMRRQLQLESIEMRIENGADDAVVLGSESQLEQVVINMITNARDAILETSGAKREGDPRGTIDVRVKADRESGLFQVTIEDTGGGMPEDVLSKVFDPFFTTKEVGVGTGLGLSVSYGIISSMSGSIIAENMEAGCRMTVELPLADEDEAESYEVSRQVPTLQ